jgi:hypothetical protein
VSPEGASEYAALRPCVTGRTGNLLLGVFLYLVTGLFDFFPTLFDCLVYFLASAFRRLLLSTTDKHDRD